jgi:hypothetical protein
LLGDAIVAVVLGFGDTLEGVPNASCTSVSLPAASRIVRATVPSASTVSNTRLFLS